MEGYSVGVVLRFVVLGSPENLLSIFKRDDRLVLWVLPWRRRPAACLLPEIFMLGSRKSFIASLGLAIFTASAANAEVYPFRVNCPEGHYVALWSSKSPDQDKDYFRVATGSTNLDCSIYDYKARRDRDLPHRWCVDPGGIIQGFPPIIILVGYSHCR